MNLSKYKFIVASGCSYGRITDFTFKPHHFFSRAPFINDQKFTVLNSFKNQILITDNDLIVINVSLGSQGSDWQSDTIMEVVTKLLDNGVHKEMIYVLVEWSQWQRMTTHPHNLFNLDTTKFDFIKTQPLWAYEVLRDDFFYEFPLNLDQNFSEKILNLFDISKSRNLPNVGKIGNRIYVSAAHTSAEQIRVIGEEFPMFLEYATKIDNEYPLENKLKIYFDNIIRTQFFLKSHNIKYNFCFMQSVLSGWVKNNWKITSSMDRIEYHPYYIDHKNNRIIKNLRYNPLSNKNEDIEVLMPEIGKKIDLLDFNNIWTYNSERFRKGGIDEWTIDNFKECGYVQMESWTFSIENMICDFNAHPFMVPYVLLWNKVSTNSGVRLTKEYEDFLWEKYWEDYNYDGFSKNLLTLSKKEYYRITKMDKIL